MLKRVSFAKVLCGLGPSIARPTPDRRAGKRTHSPLPHAGSNSHAWNHVTRRCVARDSPTACPCTGRDLPARVSLAGSNPRQNSLIFFEFSPWHEQDKRPDKTPVSHEPREATTYTTFIKSRVEWAHRSGGLRSDHVGAAVSIGSPWQVSPQKTASHPLYTPPPTPPILPSSNPRASAGLAARTAKKQRS